MSLYSERAKSRRRGLKETDRLDALVETYKSKFFGGGASAEGSARKQRQPQQKGGAQGGGLQRWFE
jgi:hypothetical protein